MSGTHLFTSKNPPTTKINENHDKVWQIPGGGGVLPYMGYTGMCRSTGYAFCLCDSETGYN